MIRTLLIFTFLIFTFVFEISASRIKDIATLQGVRDNQLVGYGVVVGLMGTGDKNLSLTETSLQMALRGLGVDLKNHKLEAQNAASVVVSVNLAPFMRVGSRLDASLASVGSATSLEGGTLLMTPLKGADGDVYAMAQGKILLMKKTEKAGVGATTQSRESQPSVTGTILQGAILEREVSMQFNPDQLKYFLRVPDFTTAARMENKINEELSGSFAKAVDAATVELFFPPTFVGNMVNLIARIEGLEVDTDRAAKVVLNPRMGIVILGQEVRIAPVAISHQNLQVKVSGALPAQGKADTNPQRKIAVFHSAPTIADIVTGLNEIGAGPEDLVAIMQSLKASGALMADVEIQ